MVELHHRKLSAANQGEHVGLDQAELAVLVQRQVELPAGTLEHALAELLLLGPDIVRRGPDDGYVPLEGVRGLRRRHPAQSGGDQRQRRGDEARQANHRLHRVTPHV